MTEKFKIGEIVEVSRPDSEQKGAQGLGLIYHAEDDQLQVLPMVQEEDQGNLSLSRISNDDLTEGELPQVYRVMVNRMFTTTKKLVVRKVGQLNVPKIDEILRQMAGNLVEKHYHAVHQNNKEFIPGKTYIRYAGRNYDSDEIKSLVDSSLDFWLTSGRFAKQFEEEFAKFLGVKHCVLTNSGSSANLLAISALTSPKLGEKRLKPGDEVITTACAFPTTVNPIIQNNLIPVFIDVDIGTYNIQVDKIESAISEKTKAIFLAHTLGNPFNLDQIMSIAKKHNLWVIEDNCDSLGSKYNGKYTGTFGHIGTASFYPAHHLTMGEGGAVVTNDPQLKNIIKSFRDWGRDCWCDSGHDNSCCRRFSWQLGELPKGYDHKFTYYHIGYNLKITDMQAAVGVAQLKKLSGFIEKRKHNWQLLDKGLKPFDEFLVLPQATPKSEPSWFGFAITVRSGAPFTRNEFVQYLENHKIATRLLFGSNLVRHPAYQDSDFRIIGDLNNSELVMANTFWIGVYPGLTKNHINYMLTVINDFLSNQELIR